MKNSIKKVTEPVTISGEMAVKLFGRFANKKGLAEKLSDSKGRAYIKCLGTFIYNGEEYIASYNSYGFGHLESGLEVGKVYPIILTAREYEGKTYFNYQIDYAKLVMKFN